ncbi:MAG: transketolase C-terminal domain-containing protein [Candidatus Omnitrophota bacterium]|nr:transketolase C-terminal domain-containing protein [Candidatus Omnitrophota bacterium]
MKKENLKTMRDVFIEELSSRMESDKSIFFVCADFGSPKLDRLRSSFKDRFINVGIAEQDLVNISTGLALEGFTVYAYAIAPFLTMRPYEQIRINLSMQSQLKDVNVNLVGVGAGLSYDVSGPTHHCLEDISIMRVLPNIEIFSPSDWVLTERFVDYSIKVKKPKYLRFDGKPLPSIYKKADIESGFSELKKSTDLCLVSTGYMTHKALRVVEKLSQEDIDIGLIDIFMLKPLNEGPLFNALKNYRYVLTLEEGFINKAGLDSIILHLLNKNNSPIRLKNIGFNDSYVFDIGSRDYLHELNKLGENSIAKDVKALLGQH